MLSGNLKIVSKMLSKIGKRCCGCFLSVSSFGYEREKEDTIFLKCGFLLVVEEIHRPKFYITFFEIMVFSIVSENKEEEKTLMVK